MVELDPSRYRAVLFDMDGVLTDTASVHSAAWKHLFDDYLSSRTDAAGEDHRPFTEADYWRYVDGKRRVDGVTSLLRSRGITVAIGSAEDGPDLDTAHGLGKRKDAYFQAAIRAEPVKVLDGAVALVDSLHKAGMRTAVVSASRNCALVLDRAGVSDLIDVRVDGVLADDLGLPGKPDPATYLEAAHQLGAVPTECVVVEDAEAGVRAGRSGGFSLVIGVDKAGSPGRLLGAGASVVVTGLAEISVPVIGDRRQTSQLPDALLHWTDLGARLRGRMPVVVLDFDGTLASIEDDPASVMLPQRNRHVLGTLASHCPVAVLSGRDLRDVRRHVGVRGLWYGGSHGFELANPDGKVVVHQAGEAELAELDIAERRVRDGLAVPGMLVERKGFALAVHYRNVEPDTAGRIVSAVTEIAEQFAALKVTSGRHVIELVPAVDWNKGTALHWLLDHMSPNDDRALALYAGDDETDEDALRAVHEDGLGIIVRSDERGDRLTWARYAVDRPNSLSALLERLASWVATSAGRAS